MPRLIAEHSLEKLRILRDYLPVYLQATTGALERVYIDAFAGPGLNRIKSTGAEIDGSPLIALKATAKNGSRFDQLIFIEQVHEIAQELRESLRVAGQGTSVRTVSVEEGDVNLVLPRVIQRINQKSPTFVFLDTDGIDPAWRTIEFISRWRTELLINFPLGMSINRNPDSPKVDAYFGTPEGRKIWKAARPGWKRDLRHLYMQRLRDLGYIYTPLERLITARGGQHLYYLLHVSKAEPAKPIMDWVSKKARADGQMPLGI